ncbi:hypothetical protein [Corynebacterium sp. A21]|uniref:hypothetical protein n=1 Tax=Corynebacterium sp. A21 TaxID=3457318 RepID=UPI003FD06748
MGRTFPRHPGATGAPIHLAGRRSDALRKQSPPFSLHLLCYPALEGATEKMRDDARVAPTADARPRRASRLQAVPGYPGCWTPPPNRSLNSNNSEMAGMRRP